MPRQRARNPYIAGRALRDGHGFFGREEILRAVREELSEPDRGSIVLFGQRRVGKTSILLRLVDDLAADGFLPIYLDLMDRADRPLGLVLHALAATAAIALDEEPPDADQFDDEGRHFLEQTLPWLYESAGERRPVFVLDEFDVLDRVHENRLADSAAAKTFFPYLRRLMETELRLGFVFAMGRRAEDLSIDVKALFKASRSKAVSVLGREAANDLIRSAERNGTLIFDDAAVERILALTSGHPFMTQLYCQRLWDRAYRKNAGAAQKPPRVTADDVDSAQGDVLEAGEHVFEWIWDGLPAAERVVFSVLAEATEGDRSLTPEELEVILQESGVRILSRELQVAPKKLAEWDLLREDEGRYSVLVELLRSWVARRKPIDTVRDELDRIVPLADSLYQTGRLFYGQRDHDAAIDQLRQALRVNPNHLKARLLLADILIERGTLDEALVELEHVRRVDRSAARYPLVRALSLQAEEFERESNEDAALEVYEQILDISPQEPAALERSVEIWTARGDAELRKIEQRIVATGSSRVPIEDALSGLERAREAYRKAGVDEKLARVEAMHERMIRRTMVDRAREHEAEEEWEQAAELWTDILSMEPDDEDLRRSAEHASEQNALQQLYTAALGLLDQERLEDAIRALADLVHRSPSYRDAAERLASSVSRKRGTTEDGHSGNIKTNKEPPAPNPLRDRSPETRVPEPLQVEELSHRSLGSSNKKELVQATDEPRRDRLRSWLASLAVFEFVFIPIALSKSNPATPSWLEGGLVAAFFLVPFVALSIVWTYQSPRRRRAEDTRNALRQLNAECVTARPPWPAQFKFAGSPNYLICQHGERLQTWKQGDVGVIWIQLEVLEADAKPLEVRGFAWDPLSGVLVIECPFTRFRVFEGPEFEEKARFPVAYPGTLEKGYTISPALAVESDLIVLARRIASSDRLNLMVIKWRENLETFESRLPSGEICALAVAPGGDFVAVLLHLSPALRILFLFRIMPEGKNLQLVFQKEVNPEVSSLLFDQLGRHLICWGDRPFIIFELDPGKNELSEATLDPAILGSWPIITGVALHTSSVAVGVRNQGIRMIDPQRGTLQSHLLPNMNATPLDITPDGAWLLAKLDRPYPSIYRLDLTYLRLQESHISGENR